MVKRRLIKRHQFGSKLSMKNSHCIFSNLGLKFNWSLFYLFDYESIFLSASPIADECYIFVLAPVYFCQFCQFILASWIWVKKCVLKKNGTDVKLSPIGIEMYGTILMNTVYLFLYWCAAMSHQACRWWRIVLEHQSQLNRPQVPSFSQKK